MAVRPVPGGDGAAVDLGWTVVSTAAEQLLGRPRHMLLGTSFRPVFAGWPVPDAAVRLLRVVDTGQPDAFEMMLRGDDRPRVVAVKVLPFVDGLVVYANDVTHRSTDDTRMRNLGTLAWCAGQCSMRARLS